MPLLSIKHLGFILALTGDIGVFGGFCKLFSDDFLSCKMAVSTQSLALSEVRLTERSRSLSFPVLTMSLSIPLSLLATLVAMSLRSETQEEPKVMSKIVLALDYSCAYARGSN